MKRALSATAFVGLILLGYDFVTHTLWVGSFALRVTVETDEPNNIKGVWALAVRQAENAQETVDTPNWPDRLQRIDDFRSAFDVDVHCSGDVSGFGRERSYFQYQTLVLGVEYQDGKRQFKLVDIPDGRERRQLTVRLP